MMGEREFFDDVNKDGVADGLQTDRNKDGRPDFLESYLKSNERRLLVGPALAALGTLGLILLSDWIGHALGWH